MASVRTRSTVLPAIALTGLSLLAAGCGDKVVSSSDLAKQVDATLTAKIGRSPGKANCPNDLSAKVGATTKCTLTVANGTKVVLKITVDTVSGNQTHFTVSQG